MAFCNQIEFVGVDNELVQPGHVFLADHEVLMAVKVEAASIHLVSLSSGNRWVDSNFYKNTIAEVLDRLQTIDVAEIHFRFCGYCKMEVATL